MTHAPATRSETLRGIAAMLIAVASFSLMDACLKLLAPHYPPLEISALRGWVSLPAIILWILATGGFGTLLRIRWPLHLLRGVLSVVMLAAFAYAVRRLPLADTYSIFFIAPLLITALAVPMLGEHVGWRHWLAIGAGLCGVMIVLQPSGAGVLTLAGLAVVVSAFCYAGSAITVRVLGRTDSSQAMVFWMLLMLAVFATTLAWPEWTMPQTGHWPALAGIALAGAIGQIAITEAFRRAPASTIAPFEYTALAWGLLFDAIFWRTVPGVRTLIGAGVVIASGLYLIRRERMQSRVPVVADQNAA